MSQVDGLLLRKLVRQYGRKGTVEEAATAMKVSKSLLEKLMADKYQSNLSVDTQRKICTVLKVSSEKLFPSARQRTKKTAT